MRERRLLAVLVVALDVVLIAAVGGFVMWNRGDAPPARAQGGAAAQGPVTPAQERAQARTAAAALERLESDPASLVAEASRARVRDARRAVPRGSKVTPDPKSWSSDGAGGGLMKVKIDPPGRKRAVTYAAVMVEEPDGWKVLATLPLGKRP